MGIQTFSDIREDDYYYVNKTLDIERLVNQNKYYEKLPAKAQLLGRFDVDDMTTEGYADKNIAHQANRFT